MSNIEPFNFGALEPTHVESSQGSVHAVWRFENGRGASVVRNGMSNGVELAVIRFTGNGVGAYELDYSTSITGDVNGWIANEDELSRHLNNIRALPSIETVEETNVARVVEYGVEHTYEDDGEIINPEWAPYRNEEDAQDAFCAMLDETNEEVEVAGHSFLPSRVLKGTDPIAFREEFLNWHAMEWDEWEADHKREIEDLLKGDPWA